VAESDHETDRESVWVAHVRADDARAAESFRQLFERWYPTLVTLAYHYVRSTDVANDVAQDAFVAWWNERTRWSWEGSAFGYLQLVVRRGALKVLRRTELERRHGAAFAAVGADPATGVAGDVPDRQVVRNELWHHVARCMAELPPRMRAVAVLRWFEGVGRTEAASALGVSVRTIDAQFVAAGKSVRACLQAHGVASGDLG